MAMKEFCSIFERKACPFFKSLVARQEVNMMLFELGHLSIPSWLSFWFQSISTYVLNSVVGNSERFRDRLVRNILVGSGRRISAPEPQQQASLFDLLLFLRWLPGKPIHLWLKSYNFNKNGFEKRHFWRNCRSRKCIIDCWPPFFGLVSLTKNHLSWKWTPSSEVPSYQARTAEPEEQKRFGWLEVSNLFSKSEDKKSSHITSPGYRGESAWQSILEARAAMQSRIHSKWGQPNALACNSTYHQRMLWECIPKYWEAKSEWRRRPW